MYAYREKIFFFLLYLQSEKVMAKQMEFLCNQAALERRLSTGCYRQNSEEHSPNGMSLDSADGQGTVAPRHGVAASGCVWRGATFVRGVTYLVREAER